MKTQSLECGHDVDAAGFDGGCLDCGTVPLEGEPECWGPRSYEHHRGLCQHFDPDFGLPEGETLLPQQEVSK